MTYFLGRPERRFTHIYFALCTSVLAIAIGGTLVWMLRGHAPDAIPETGGMIAAFLSLWLLYFMQDRDMHLSFSFGFGGALVFVSSAALKLADSGREDMEHAWPWLLVAGFVMIHRVLVFDRLGLRMLRERS